MIGTLELAANQSVLQLRDRPAPPYRRAGNDELLMDIDDEEELRHSLPNHVPCRLNTATTVVLTNLFGDVRDFDDDKLPGGTEDGVEDAALDTSSNAKPALLPVSSRLGQRLVEVAMVQLTHQVSEGFARQVIDGRAEQARIRLVHRHDRVCGVDAPNRRP
jgi:hypothetical protein